MSIKSKGLEGYKALLGTSSVVPRFEVNNKCLTYPDGWKVITVYNKPYLIQEEGWEPESEKKKEKGMGDPWISLCWLWDQEKIDEWIQELKNQDLTEDEIEERVIEKVRELYRWESVNRSKRIVRDYALANDFAFFITLTFSNDYADEDRHKYVQKYIRYLRDKYGRFRYLVVPEKTKKGKWHYHALISDIPIELQNSGHSTRTGRVIYNILGWKYGFSTFVRVGSKREDRQKLATYLVKYISKQFYQREFNERRFWNSLGLLKPKRTYNVELVGLDLVEQFSNDHCSIYYM